ncbi:hypothetical protein CDAR_240501 [Caerostris darwini]|uniref:Uncharacterized protein n=1 Tax=Caerostris darwini TaxID=1538125 RepID=A0AAV4PRK6_9ARAC|nr:hypothetical protein CDAR_240501 [Caerostris darwini]
MTGFWPTLISVCIHTHTDGREESPGRSVAGVVWGGWKDTPFPSSSIPYFVRPPFTLPRRVRGVRVEQTEKVYCSRGLSLSRYVPKAGVSDAPNRMRTKTYEFFVRAMIGQRRRSDSIAFNYSRQATFPFRFWGIGSLLEHVASIK